ncbi:hypothetical protein [Pseudonocardia sp. GCM10023141]|uniref:hypothetical protein n=1 Tax=Pseudonocardia sp. GCM10023141 TaxID=3252653 RepID=UPI00360737A9
MNRMTKVRTAGVAAQVASSQIAVAASNYLVLALAARELGTGIAAVSSYYLLINTVGRGLFAAVELETTRAVASAAATGGDVRQARVDALRHTGILLAGAIVLVGASAPLLAAVVGSSGSAIALLAVGSVTMAASYLVRGPLAGTQQYGRYAATFWLEAVVGIGTAAVLTLTDVRSATAWIAVFALSPVVGTLVLLLRSPRVTAALPTDVGPIAPRNSLPELLWSAALLMAGQGAWNLAPVIVNARLGEASAAATGFFAVAVILRAPVLLFPSVQALLLPAITAMVDTGDTAAVRRTTRRLGLLLLAGGAVWLVLAVVLVPTLARVVLAATVIPDPWVLLALAASTVIGAAAQIGQTHLVAARRQSGVALAWISGLLVLLAVGLALAPPMTAATLGQLVGAAVVLVVLDLARRRIPTTGARS